MNNPRFIALAACCLVLVSGRVPAADNLLIGEWFPAEIDDSGLGGVMDFQANGRMIVSAGAAVYLKYKVQGNTIVMEPPEGPPQSMVFTVTNDTLTLDCGDGKEQKLTRVKGTGGEGLLGKWTGKYGGGKAREVREFTTNICYLSVPFMTATGTYSLRGSTLRMEYQGRRVSAKWKIDGDVLTLTAPGGEPSKLRRKERSAAGVVSATAEPPNLTASQGLLETVKLDALLQHLEGLKDATFIRNDKAIEMKEAVPMMRRKWEAMDEEIKTASEFIDKIMTVSSSGAKKPYLIRFNDGKETPVADYLKAELKKLEEKARKTKL